MADGIVLGGSLQLPIYHQVALGLHPQTVSIARFGRNHELGKNTTPEDVWSGGGDYTGQPTQLETVELFSSDANDTLAGTGARLVLVVGLDTNLDPQFEVLDMAGTTPTVTSAPYRRVTRIRVLASGTGNTNAGTITARHTTTTANVFAIMQATYGQDDGTHFTIPNKTIALITYIHIGMIRDKGNDGAAQVSLRLKPFGLSEYSVRTWDVGQGSHFTRDKTLPLVLQGKDDMIFRVDSVSDNETVVSVSYELQILTDPKFEVTNASERPAIEEM